MPEPKLLRELKNLSQSELHRFGDFVHSPFFNQHLPTTQLFEFIQSQLPELAVLNKKEVFKSIYGKTVYKEYKVNTLMSYLMGLLEEFHGQVIWEGKKNEQQLNQLEYCYQKNRTALFKSQELRFRKQLEASQIRDSQHYFQQHRFHLFQDYFSLQQGSRKQVDSLQKQVAAFDVYYISEKLKYSCDMLSRMNVINKTYELHFLPELLSYLQDNWVTYQNIPPIETYHGVLMTLMESEKEAHYDKLKDLLLQHYNSFSEEEAQLLYDYAQNYCIKKINEGKPNYLKELFKLYQQLIENGLILKNGLLSEWDYQNIVTIGCRFKAFEWTQDFIENYKVYLTANARENAYTYNLASFYYSTQQYKAALLLIQQVAFSDEHYYLGAKFIQCKIYYDLEETEALLSLLDSFRIYIMRNKNMIKQQQQAPLNFIRFTKKLALLRERKEVLNVDKFQKQLEKLKQNILQTAAIVNVDWLVEKLKDF